MKKKIAVLFGGQSTEHEVSTASATSVLKNINRAKYDVYPIGITKNGVWFKYTGNLDNIESGEWEKDESCKIPQGQNILFDKDVDIVFPVLHGLFGEDGTIQGMCKIFNIPCVGPGVMSSAICMDKIYTKYLLQKFNIKQADYVVINGYEYEADKDVILEKVEKRLGYDVFIKPSNGGSSVGITKAHNKEELTLGIKEALKHDRKVLIEKAINAREIEVSVLGNDYPEASIPGEVVPAKEFYDYEAKYKSEASKLLIPAALGASKLEIIKEQAIKIYKILDCAGMARVDFLVDKQTEEVYLNEVNTIPGFTKISMYPKMWDATGKNFETLIDELIMLAIERNNK
jgi:D-alanine-D-alanine ligase